MCVTDPISLDLDRFGGLEYNEHEIFAAPTAAKGAILTIMNDGLIPAFMELRTIRAPETGGLPIADRLQPYEDFARKLRKASAQDQLSF